MTDCEDVRDEYEARIAQLQGELGKEVAALDEQPDQWKEEV